MKISFSTLGCPGWSWEDILVTAKDLGLDGIEIRGIENELYVPEAKPFADSSLQATKARLEKLKLEIPCLTSSCLLPDKAGIDSFIKEGKEYIDLAEKLGTPFIRVLGDANAEKSHPVDTEYIAANLSILAKYAEGRNVKVLVETNGFFADSKEILRLINKVDNPNTGILWDIHHPFRFMNEPIEKTYNALKNHIMFVHIKDSVIEGGKVRYKMMGYGDVPVRNALLLLKNGGYQGYVSLEWVKRWCIELEDPGVVFSQFVNYTRDVLV